MTEVIDLISLASSDPAEVTHGKKVARLRLILSKLTPNIVL